MNDVGRRQAVLCGSCGIHETDVVVGGYGWMAPPCNAQWLECVVIDCQSTPTHSESSSSLLLLLILLLLLGVVEMPVPLLFWGTADWSRQQWLNVATTCEELRRTTRHCLKCSCRSRLTGRLKGSNLWIPAVSTWDLLNEWVACLWFYKYKALWYPIDVHRVNLRSAHTDQRKLS